MSRWFFLDWKSDEDVEIDYRDDETVDLVVWLDNTAKVILELTKDDLIRLLAGLLEQKGEEVE